MFGRSKPHSKTVGNNIKGVRNKCDLSVWRGEKNRAFREIQAIGGFFARGRNRSINDHIAGVGYQIPDKNIKSAYVSFTIKSEIAAAYSQSDELDRGGLYRCNLPAIFINVPLLPKCSLNANAVIYSSSDAEIAGFEHSPSSDINSFTLNGVTEYNVDYKYRNYSIKILSAADQEQQNIQEILRASKELAEDQRYLSAVEAEILAEQLNIEFAHVINMPESFLLFEHIRRDFSENQAIEAELHKYHTEMRAQLGINQLQRFFPRGVSQHVSENELESSPPKLSK